MSDAPDKHDKQFDPTPKRLQKAREDGNVLRSREIVSVGMLVAGGGVLALGLPLAFQALRRLATTLFLNAPTTTLDAPAVQTLFAEIGLKLLGMMAPLALGLMAAAVGLNVMQSGWNVSLKVLQPKPERINPLQGLKRMFSARGMFDFGKSVAKIAIVGPLAYLVIVRRLPEIVMLHTLPLKAILTTAAGWMAVLLFQMIGVLLLLAGIDFAFERWRYREDLKMTAKELKDEAKESEGDPHLKGKRRQVARELAQRPRLDHAILQADVVVTNPTHYAIALRYDPTEGAAPRVLAKGIRKRALRLKALAAEHGVPTVEDRPLARALYDTVPETEEIPEELYAAVAALLAEVYKRKGRG